MIFLWLVLMGGTLTVAALFRYDLLLILFMIEIVLLLVFLILPHVLASKIEIQAPQSVIGTIGETTDFTVKAAYRGNLPAPTVKACLHTDPGRLDQGRFTGKADLSLTSEIHIPVKTPHFGMFKGKVKWVRTYEYLGLFHSSKHPDLRTTFFILPSDSSIQSKEQKTDSDFRQGEVNSGRIGMDEIRDVRDFREGDRLRNVSWKQSARFGHLMTREYERDASDSVRVTATLPEKQADADEWDGKMQDLYDRIAPWIAEGRIVILDDGQHLTALHTKRDVEKYFISLCRYLAQDSGEKDRS